MQICQFEPSEMYAAVNSATQEQDRPKKKGEKKKREKKKNKIISLKINKLCPPVLKYYQ